MKRMLIVPLLCILTFGCEEISNEISALASDLETGLKDIVAELDREFNGNQSVSNGDSTAESVKPRPSAESATAQAPQLPASQPAKSVEVFTGKVVRKRFTKGSGLLSNDSFKLIVQSGDGRTILFDVRGRGAENMDFIYNLHDSVSFPLDSEAMKKKFSLGHARFMDVDIQLHKPVATQPALQPIPVLESAEPELAKPPAEEKPDEFGTLFDEESPS